mmetsp:Transcript_21487/g.74152  ORF Transcript_21487/g.74152 Transcript_21487/m.74152 type:complete len:362 (+) Transcript_21487:52-1137(+)
MRFPKWLCEAGERGQSRIVKRFIAAIPAEDVNRTFDSGEGAPGGRAAGLTPLAYAVTLSFHFRDMVRLLLARGADARCPVYSLLWTGYLIFQTTDSEIVAMLIDAGSDVNSRDEFGRTPLMAAACCGHVSTLHLLLSRGADMDLRDHGGLTVDDHARMPAPQTTLLNEGRRCEKKHEAMCIIAGVRAAGSWEAYSTYPRRSLLALRVLCEHGRAKPPDVSAILENMLPAMDRICAADSLFDARFWARTILPAPLPILARLFPYRPPVGEDPRTSLRARTAKIDLPKEVFWLILSFWRTLRDPDPGEHNGAGIGHWLDIDRDSDVDDDVPQLEELSDSDDDVLDAPVLGMYMFVTPAGPALL